MNFVGVGVYTV